MSNFINETMPSTSRDKSFLRYVHNFRGFAIILIVLSHLLGFLKWETGTENWQVIWNVIFRNGTVYFVFIAGFLFQHLSKKYEYRDYLKKKFSNVILPYLIISISAVLSCIIAGATDSPV
jgi:fucose 4-O-acetylase-like acetyltransferase